MASKNTKVVVAKFADDEDEYGETAIRVIELGEDWGGLDGQVWGEWYNKHHERKIESAKFYSLDYLKDHWEEIRVGED